MRCCCSLSDEKLELSTAGSPLPAVSPFTAGSAARGVAPLAAAPWGLPAESAVVSGSGGGSAALTSLLSVLLVDFGFGS